MGESECECNSLLAQLKKGKEKRVWAIEDQIMVTKLRFTFLFVLL